MRLCRQSSFAFHLFSLKKYKIDDVFFVWSRTKQTRHLKFENIILWPGRLCSNGADNTQQRFDTFIVIMMTIMIIIVIHMDVIVLLTTRPAVVAPVRLPTMHLMVAGHLYSVCYEADSCGSPGHKCITVNHNIPPPPREALANDCMTSSFSLQEHGLQESQRGRLIHTHKA